MFSHRRQHFGIGFTCHSWISQHPSACPNLKDLQLFTHGICQVPPFCLTHKDAKNILKVQDVLLWDNVWLGHFPFSWMQLLLAPLYREWLLPHDSLNIYEMVEAHHHIVVNVVKKWYTNHPSIPFPIPQNLFLSEWYCIYNITLAMNQHCIGFDRWRRQRSVTLCEFACRLRHACKSFGLRCGKRL